MYEGFERFEIQTSDPDVKIAGRVGGRGPAVLLLHGNPLTHVHWHLVAPRLAQRFTVIAPDLRGYGDFEMDSADIVRLKPLPCGHYPAEQVPDQVFAELDSFFGS